MNTPCEHANVPSDPSVTTNFQSIVSFLLEEGKTSEQGREVIFQQLENEIAFGNGTQYSLKYLQTYLQKLGQESEWPRIQEIVNSVLEKHSELMKLLQKTYRFKNTWEKSIPPRKFGKLSPSFGFFGYTFD